MHVANVVRKTHGVVVALFCWAVASGGTALAAGIRLTTQEWAPYQSEQDGKLDGIAVRTIRCVMDIMQMPVTIEVLPWNRAQDEVKQGGAAGFFAASQTPERDSFAELSAPIASQIWRWYLLPGSTSNPSNSLDLKVGALRGSAMEQVLREGHYRDIHRAGTTESLLRMLHQGHLDAFLANEIVINDTLRSLRMPQDSIRSIVDSDHPLGAYFGKTFLAEHEGFLINFNAAIPSCRE